VFALSTYRSWMSGGGQATTGRSRATELEMGARDLQQVETPVVLRHRE
jgi:hypothetical protein